MSYINKQNFLALIIAGISAGSTLTDISGNIFAKADELGLDTSTESFHDFVAELTEDYIAPLRNAVAGKLGLSKLGPMIEMLFSTSSIDDKELKQKLSNYTRNQSITLDQTQIKELIALQKFAHPTLLGSFFPALLDLDLSTVENTERKRSNAVISLANSFGLKITSKIAKDLLKLKEIFAASEHFPVLKEIIKNLLSANISEKDLKAVLKSDARSMGYDFQDEQIEQLVQLKKDYAILLNGPEATPGRNIIATAMFSSAMLYQFPTMVSHMIAFSTVNAGLKRVLGDRLASWIPLTAVFSSMVGYPLPHSTCINMLKDFIFEMIQEHPTAAFLVLVPASVLYFRFDDVRALYNKGSAFISDPLGFEEMFSDGFGDAFSSYADQMGIANPYAEESSSKVLVFPRKPAIASSSTDQDTRLTTSKTVSTLRL